MVLLEIWHLKGEVRIRRDDVPGAPGAVAEVRGHAQDRLPWHRGRGSKASDRRGFL